MPSDFFSDTDPRALEVFFSLQRRRTPSQKLKQVFEMTELVWYQMGGEVSERQWNDLLGIVKVKGQELDPDYLQRWAAHLGVALLLERLWETEQSWGS